MGKFSEWLEVKKWFLKELKTCLHCADLSVMVTKALFDEPLVVGDILKWFTICKLNLISYK